MKIFQFSMIYIIITAAKCEQEEKETSKMPLLNFRKQIEETDAIIKVTEKDNIHNNSIVEFLVKNVKIIFKDLFDTNEITGEIKSETVSLRPTITLSDEDGISVQSIFTDDVMLYENLSLNNSIDKTHEATYNTSIGENNETNRRYKLLELSKDTTNSEKQYDYVIESSRSVETISTESDSESGEQRRSCISCDNVNMEDCSDPRNKLIPSIVCERENDLCYSLHTPFGIIDRGCYNVNHNLTTYVCTCNLCNYISISEMPYIFYNKQDWVDNVVELSRTGHFRKSVFKDMSCLRCEVNVTTKRVDIVDSANCLEGNLGMLPIQECENDEVCAVRAIKSEGYIWRGCIKSPLYNYWWAFCDSDLCNYDRLVSIYDFVR